MADRYLGTITTSGGAAKGNDEATAFVIPTAAKLTLQPDVDCYVKFHENGTEAKATSGTGIKLLADDKFGTSSPSRNGIAAPVFISGVPSARMTVIPVAGDVSLKVFERRGNE